MFLLKITCRFVVILSHTIIINIMILVVDVVAPSVEIIFHDRKLSG